MATHVTVTSSTFRQTKIKVTGQKPMTEVLEEACKNLGLDRDGYSLKYKTKVLDPSLPFRLTNLPNGAKLDLVVKSKSAGVVQVALQLPTPYNAKLPPNGRILKKFPSTFTIWQVLRQFEESDEAKQAQLNVTGRGVPQSLQSGAGQLFYETPVLSAMGRTLDGIDKFRQTLGQLGYNQGSVLMHLSFKKTEMTLAAAMEEINRYFKKPKTETDAAPSSSTQSSSLSPSRETPVSTTTATTSQPPSSEPRPADNDESREMDVDSQPVPPATTSESPPPVLSSETSADGSAEKAGGMAESSGSLQPVGIFAAPASSTPAAASAPFRESDFMPTVADAQRHQASLLKGTANRRLPSDKELADQAASHEARLAAVQSVEMRVRFPDNTSASWVVLRPDSGAHLYRCVRTVMANANLPFKLLLPPRTPIADSEAVGLIQKYQLTGKGAIANLVWDDAVSAQDRGRQFLKDSAAREAKQIAVPQVPEGKEETIAPRPSGPAKGGSQGEGTLAGDQLKKLGKFFRLPGKK